MIAAVNAPPAPFVPPERHLTPGYALLLTGFGPAPEHARLVTQIRERVPPLFNLVTPMPYVELQKLFDEANAWGSCCYDKGAHLAALSELLFYRLDGAAARMTRSRPPSGGRSPRFAAFIVGLTPDTGSLAVERRWVRDLWDALRHMPSTTDRHAPPRRLGPPPRIRRPAPDRSRSPGPGQRDGQPHPLLAPRQ